MVLSELKYPNMRTELKEYILSLSDLSYQEKYWINGDRSDHVEHDELSYVLHFIYDDTVLSENPILAIGQFLIDEAEADQIKKIVSIFDKIFNTYGKNRSDKFYVDLLEWKEILYESTVMSRLLSR